jgi:hypothetical protein
MVVIAADLGRFTTIWAFEMREAALNDEHEERTWRTRSSHCRRNLDLGRPRIRRTRDVLDISDLTAPKTVESASHTAMKPSSSRRRRRPHAMQSAPKRMRSSA